jgi:uncharacterized surface protein with fasciclin (FAS1) repeats
MSKRQLLRVIVLATLAMGLAGCASTPAPTSVADTAARTPELSTLAGLLQQSGLADTLKGNGPYTLFAPTNDAFKALPAGMLAKLAADKEQLRAVLSFHVLPAKAMAADVKAGPAKTLQGSNVTLALAGTFVTVEDAVVQTPDVAASNGVVHLIDRVLVPPKK